MKIILPKEFNFTSQLLREFFLKRGFLEVHTQSLLSILAACEDPFNIAKFDYAGDVWPMPQTGQMWLEYYLLKNPELPGVFCVSTSYRQEPEPKEGRHDLIFPMFEFETHGDMENLKKLEMELLEFLGFGPKDKYPVLEYKEAARRYGVKELTDAEEDRVFKDHGPAAFLVNFPEYTSPFWNMKRTGELANKIDVILYGIETIGSAERSTDPEEMRGRFHSISGGEYAKKLFAEFRKDRVERELDEFLKLDFFPRCGGGIGMTRMIRALKLLGKL